MDKPEFRDMDVQVAAAYLVFARHRTYREAINYTSRTVAQTIDSSNQAGDENVFSDRIPKISFKRTYGSSLAAYSAVYSNAAVSPAERSPHPVCQKISKAH